ncbi:hypothetical protein PSEUDO9AZ_10116 [Pseudomonas sp. 9AZ]|nr:hypothetical protein PSEUDO9AZ_10116 [Pseudomonas sp. 9AZ]
MRMRLVQAYFVTVAAYIVSNASRGLTNAHPARVGAPGC